MSASCTFEVDEKIGFLPLRHQLPALTGHSFAHHTNSVSATNGAASSIMRSAAIMRSRVYGPLKSPARTCVEQSETLIPASGRNPGVMRRTVALHGESGSL
eukprot:6213799-Pleurochrysis_carterae.AAC.5